MLLNFCFVEAPIDDAHHVLHRKSALVPRGPEEADAGRRVHGLPVHLPPYLVYGVKYPPGYGPRLGGRGGPEQDSEFVPSVTAGNVSRPALGLNPRPQNLQVAVADEMAETVIDGLEVIAIQEKKTKSLALGKAGSSCCRAS